MPKKRGPPVKNSPRNAEKEKKLANLRNFMDFGNDSQEEDEDPAQIKIYQQKRRQNGQDNDGPAQSHRSMKELDMELSDDDSPERNDIRGQQRFGEDQKQYKSKTNVLLHASDCEDDGDDGGVMWPSNQGKPQR